MEVEDSLPEEIPDAALKDLTPEYLDDFLYDIGVIFNETFEQAPVVTRPLPTGYASYKKGSPKFIRWDWSIFGLDIISFVVSPDVFETKDKLKQILVIRAEQFMTKELNYKMKQAGKEPSKDYTSKLKEKEKEEEKSLKSLSGISLIFPNWCHCFSSETSETSEKNDYDAIANKDADKDGTEKDISADADKNAIENLNGENEAEGDIEMAAKDEDKDKSEIAIVEKSGDSNGNGNGNESAVAEKKADKADKADKAAAAIDDDDDEANADTKKVVRKEKQLYVDPENRACDKSIDELSFWECWFYPPPVYKSYKYITFKKLRAEMDAAAPGFKLVPNVKPILDSEGKIVKVVKIVTKEMLRLNMVRLMFLKSKEFADVHAMEYKKLFESYSLLKNISFLITSLITAALFIFGSTAGVVFGSSCAAIVVTAIGSWIQFKKWEERFAAHDEASKKFRRLEKNIFDSIAAISPASATYLTKSHQGMTSLHLFQSKLSIKIATFKDNISAFFLKCFCKCFGLGDGKGMAFLENMKETFQSSKNILEKLMGVVDTKTLKKLEDEGYLKPSVDNIIKIIQLTPKKDEPHLESIAGLRDEFVERVAAYLPQDVMENLVNLPRIIIALKDLINDNAAIEDMKNPIELFSGALTPEMETVKKDVVMPLLNNVLKSFPFSDVNNLIQTFLEAFPLNPDVVDKENQELIKEGIRDLTNSVEGGNFKKVFSLVLKKLMSTTRTTVAKAILESAIETIRPALRKFLSGSLSDILSGSLSADVDDCDKFSLVQMLRNLVHGLEIFSEWVESDNKLFEYYLGMSEIQGYSLYTDMLREVKRLSNDENNEIYVWEITGLIDELIENISTVMKFLQSADNCISFEPDAFKETLINLKNDLSGSGNGNQDNQDNESSDYLQKNLVQPALDVSLGLGVIEAISLYC